MRNQKLLLAPCLCLAIGCAQLAQAASAAATPMPANIRFTVTGTTTVAPSPFASKKLAKAAATSTNVLPRLPKRAYNEPDIESTLTDLFQNWAPARAQYAGYFVLMPQKFDIKAEGTNLMTSVADDQVAVLQHWTLAQFPGVGLSLIKPSALKSASVFQGGGANDRIFVRLDGFGAPVPIAVARVVEADFVRGFATRLFMSAYIEAAKNYQGAGGLSGVKLDFGGVNTAATNVFAAYTQIASYPNAQTLDVDIAAVAANSPVAPVSLLYGWQAAGQLLKDDNVATHNLRNDVWRLMSYHYAPEQIGAMVGYTLQYLAGYAENQRVLSIANNQGDPGSTNDLSKIVMQAAADKNVSAAKNLVTSFGNLLTAESYAIATNTKLSATDRVTALTRYGNLIDGYRRGVSSATNDIYNDIADISYGIGYATGFNDGYALGFAAGWQDGWVSGYTTAWLQASLTINNLEAQISSLQSQLNAANNGGDCGFWCTVGNIVSTGSTIVGIIGSLF
ncbi:MAG TPA: hypothetical protein VNX02_17050 [Steroidobacteraceae bacterium]|nr:hypothetical protein [Steroidobacteraceae bacterium]